MNTMLTNEQHIQAGIDQLKNQFPNTQDLYREACVLLFFRYGITPTANKLYQYVRKGSMSAPAEALNKFWLDLREKSRVCIEGSDLPDTLKESTGNFVAALWRQAQEAAQANFAAQIAEADEKVAQATQEVEIAHEDLAKVELSLNETRLELKDALQTLAESEKNHAVDISTLATSKKSLLALQDERAKHEQSLVEARLGFSRDLEKVNVALAKAEERFHALEARSLLELDRERQRVRMLEKELDKHHRQRLKDMASVQGVNSSLREKLGLLNGQLNQVKIQLRQTTSRLNATQKRFSNINFRTTKTHVSQAA